MPGHFRKIIVSVVAISLLLLAGTVAFGRGEEKPLLDVLRSDCDVTELAFSLPAVESTVVETKGGPFALLSLGDTAFTEEIGRPSLPVIRELIEIPHGARVAVALEDTRFVDRRLADLGIDERIVPTQEPIPATPGAGEAALFAFDREAYASDRFRFDDRVRIGGEMVARGRRLLVVEILPIDYRPLSGVIRVLESARIRLSFTEANPVATAGALDRLATADFDRVVHDVVLNAALFEASLQGLRNRAPTRAGGYLMIAAPAFKTNAALLSLKGWRESEGYTVTLVDTGTTGTSTTAIQSYIENAYNTWNPAPEYLLLVGDTDTIPHWVGQGNDTPATDLYYACVDGTDYFPDVKRGRFPVRSSSQLTNLCNKILAMTTNTLEAAAFMAGNDYWAQWEQIHDAVIADHFDPNGWSYDKLYEQTYGATTADVRNAFNGGRTVGAYRGHGSTTSWADGPKFTQTNVRGLTNTIYPSIWSFSCLTGKYSNTECFGETWVRDDHGSTSFYGASVVSYTPDNNKLYRKTMQGWFWYGHGRLGDMIDYGQYELHLVMGGGEGYKRAYYEMYNLMGDPAMTALEASGGPPVTDIKVDGSDGPINIPHTQPATITLTLDPGGQAGVAHDWWVFATMSFTKDFWWRYPGRWTPSAVPLRSFEGGLFPLNAYPIHQGPIPAGWYTFTFAVDSPNNSYEGTWIDTIEVQSY